MRITLVVIGLGIIGIATIMDGSPRIEVPIGYFLVASAALIAAALWRPKNGGNEHYLAFQRIYSVLAPEPMEMEALVKRLSGNGYSQDEWRSVYREAIGRMLAEGQLTIEDGAVAVPQSSARTDSIQVNQESADPAASSSD